MEDAQRRALAEAVAGDNPLASMSPLDLLTLRRELTAKETVSPEQRAANLRQTAEEGLGVLPVIGNALSARDAWDSGGDAVQAFGEGDWRRGALATALAGISGVGAVTGLPFGRTAGKVAKNADRTVFSGAGPTDDYSARSVLLPHSHFDEEHLARVREQMQRLGSPEIRGFPMGDDFVAIEGSHRLRAANDLDVPVRLKSIEDQSHVNLDELGLDDNLWFDGERNIPVQDFINWYSDGVSWQPTYKKVKVLPD